MSLKSRLDPLTALTMSIGCPLRSYNTRFISRLFLKYPFTGSIWTTFKTCFNIRGLPANLDSLYISWRKEHIHPISRRAWDQLLMSMLWNVWHERIKRIFLRWRRSSIYSVSWKGFQIRLCPSIYLLSSCNTLGLGLPPNLISIVCEFLGGKSIFIQSREEHEINYWCRFFSTYLVWSE